MEQKSLPNATGSLVLGIISIVGSCFAWGVVGLICAIIGLVLSKKDKTLYAANPEAYTESSYKQSNAGRVCSIIGLIFSILVFVISAIVVLIWGAAILSLPWEEMQQGM